MQKNVSTFQKNFMTFRIPTLARPHLISLGDTLGPVIVKLCSDQTQSWNFKKIPKLFSCLDENF